MKTRFDLDSAKAWMNSKSDVNTSQSKASEQTSSRHSSEWSCITVFSLSDTEKKNEVLEEYQQLVSKYSNKSSDSVDAYIYDDLDVNSNSINDLFDILNKLESSACDISKSIETAKCNLESFYSVENNVSISLDNKTIDFFAESLDSINRTQSLLYAVHKMQLISNDKFIKHNLTYNSAIDNSLSCNHIKSFTPVINRTNEFYLVINGVEDVSHSYDIHNSCIDDSFNDALYNSSYMRAKSIYD